MPENTNGLSFLMLHAARVNASSLDGWRGLDGRSVSVGRNANKSILTRERLRFYHSVLTQ